VVELSHTAIKIARFLSSMKDAPSVVRSPLAQVRSMTVILRHLDVFITDSQNYRHTNTTDILVGDLVLVLTGCLYCFSKLQALLQGCSTDEPNGLPLNFWDRARWAAKELDLVRSLANLQRHKTSINVLIMLSVHLDPLSPLVGKATYH